MYFIPTKHYIQNLKVGDIAPNSLNNEAIVKEITECAQDTDGKWFVCYVTEFGKYNGGLTHSLKEGRLDRTLEITSKWKSWELDEIESHLLRQGRKYSRHELSDDLKHELERINRERALPPQTIDYGSMEDYL